MHGGYQGKIVLILQYHVRKLMQPICKCYPVLDITQFVVNYFQLFKDLLNPTVEEEKRKHKLKRLVQSPNSYFMDVKCPGKVIS